jgi:hypothetical protein
MRDEGRDFWKWGRKRTERKCVLRTKGLTCDSFAKPLDFASALRETLAKFRKPNLQAKGGLQ